VKSIEFAEMELQVSSGGPGGAIKTGPRHDSFSGLVVATPTWKRALDISLSILALAMLSPVWLAAVFALVLSGNGSVLFSQARVGRGEKLYTMFKFRTMNAPASNDASVSKAERESFLAELSGTAEPSSETKLYRPQQQSRVTRVGQILRRYSIDELPQLLNVLRGDMSLVGPRPALPWEAELFSIEQRRRHTVLPGMTGLWQVNGRNSVSSAEMLTLDLKYVDQFSLVTDLKILLKTPKATIWDRHTG